MRQVFMGLNREIILALLVLLFFQPSAFAYYSYISPARLADESDLIIIGRIEAIQETDEKSVIFQGFDSRGKTDTPRYANVRYARVMVTEVLKGKAEPIVSVKFIRYKHGVKDLMDADFPALLGSSVLLYLQDNQDAQKSYRVTHWWYGVAAFNNGRYQQQSTEGDVATYVKNLKAYIKKKVVIDYDAITKQLDEAEEIVNDLKSNAVPFLSDLLHPDYQERAQILLQKTAKILNVDLNHPSPGGFWRSSLHHMSDDLEDLRGEVDYRRKRTAGYF